MELHLSLRLSRTMMNPMPAASILQKRVISIRDQVRHTGSGRLPQEVQSTASTVLQDQGAQGSNWVWLP